MSFCSTGSLHTGHMYGRFSGVLHFAWRVVNRRSFSSVAPYTLIGMFTRPKVIAPDQTARAIAAGPSRRGLIKLKPGPASRVAKGQRSPAREVPSAWRLRFLRIATREELPVHAGVGAEAPVEQVRAAPAIERVRAVLPEEAVVLVPTGERVVAVAPVQDVVAAEAEQVVV